MAVVIPIRSTVPNPGWTPNQPEPEAFPSDLAGWHPEQLWLSTGCWSRSVQDAMVKAVSTAIDAVLTAETRVLPRHELLLVLRYCRKEVAWLRLAARILRGPSSTATTPVRLLAGAALFVAAVRHNDLLACIEFSAEATGHAVMLDADLVPGDVALPPGMATVSQLAGRMRRRGREVLARRMSWPDLDSVGPCLGRALAEDPLLGLSELSRVGGAA